MWLVQMPVECASPKRARLTLYSGAYFSTDAHAQKTSRALAAENVNEQLSVVSPEGLLFTSRNPLLDIFRSSFALVLFILDMVS